MKREPTYGTTKSGAEVHAKTRHYTPQAKFSWSSLKTAIKEVEGINAKVAVLITSAVGTMACAYLFALLAFISLPNVIMTGDPIQIVSWTAQTFLQLVLLAIILVGQKVQAAAADARAQKQFEDIEFILDYLNLETEGGLAQLRDEILEAMKDNKPPTIPPSIYG
jgi:hypothetical protein